VNRLFTAATRLSINLISFKQNKN